MCGLSGSNCHSNLTGNKIKCRLCNLGSKITARRLGSSVKVHYVNEKLESNFDFPNELNGYRELFYKGVNVGLGPLSTFVSLTRNIEEHLNEESKRILKNLTETSISTLEKFSEIVSEIRYDKIIFFNGRFAEIRGVMEYCKKIGLNFETVEFDSKNGFDDVRKLVFNNALPHSKEIFRKNFKNILKSKDSDYFKNRMQGNYAGDKTYTNGFKESSGEQFLAELSKESRPMVVYFMSSEDEIYALGDEWKITNYLGSQFENIEWLIKYYSINSDYNLVIRAHPNLSGLNFDYVGRKWASSGLSNIYYLPPESSIDSYSLMGASALCLSFSSSILVECSYHKRPTILLGDAFFKGLEICLEPVSEKDLLYMLGEARNLKRLYDLDKFRNNAVKYGQLMLTSFGRTFSHIDWNKFRYTKPFPIHWF